MIVSQYFYRKMLLKYTKYGKAIALSAIAFLIVIITGVITNEKAYTNPAPNSIQLSGIIRDFKGNHPDFERTPGVNNFAYGLDSNITLDTLDSERKPKYKGSSYSTTNQANFEQWYRDVAGVNQKTNYTIQLTDPDNNGTYTYYNPSFFPLDDLADFDAEGREHNYHFTYEIHSNFTYKGGETFEFRGDDDVWVYINGKKVIDLGGVHAEEVQSVNLDAIASSVGITPDNNYSFDLFFAERHTTQSNFKIETTIEFRLNAD